MEGLTLYMLFDLLFLIFLIFQFKEIFDFLNFYIFYLFFKRFFKCIYIYIYIYIYSIRQSQQALKSNRIRISARTLEARFYRKPEVGEDQKSCQNTYIKISSCNAIYHSIMSLMIRNNLENIILSYFKIFKIKLSKFMDESSNVIDANKWNGSKCLCKWK